MKQSEGWSSPVISKTLPPLRKKGARQPGQGLKAGFSIGRSSRQKTRARPRKHMVAADPLRDTPDDFQGKIRQRYLVRPMIFRSFLGYFPGTGVKIYFRPHHAGDFFPPQITRNSQSASTRVRFVAALGRLLPITGLTSQSPSPIAHAKNELSAVLAWVAATAPLLTFNSATRAATSNRPIQ